MIGPVLFCSYHKEVPEEELDRLLREADRDIEAGLVVDMREGLTRIWNAYGLSGALDE
ncbi:MAG: hypothetical protein Q4A01_07485 [Coriobacteriales bacterium]|nr:hypothetical protein [Coriobacteriales bacterium]